MRVNLPVPPVGAGRFISNLVSQLTAIFRKIRPASGWKDKEAPLTSAKVAGAKQPTWSVFRDSISMYEFSSSSENEVYISFHMPHDMALSYTDETGAVTSPKLYPHVHYSSNAATPSTGLTRWGFEWTYAHGYGTDTFDASQTVYVEHTPEGVQYQHEIGEVTDANAITGNFEVDGILLMRFFREVTGDLNSDSLHVITLDLHYLSDGLETIERNRGPASKPWTKQSVL